MPRTVSVRPAQPTVGSSNPLAILAPTLGRYLLVYSQACNAIGHEQCPQYDPVLGQLLNTRGEPTGPAVTLEPRALGSEALTRTGSRTYLLAWPGTTATGTPYFDDTAMTTIYPHKSEILVQTVAP